MRIDGKSVVITGSSRGMGRLTALGMAAVGAQIVVNGTVPEPVDAVVAEIRANDGIAVPSYDTVATMEGARAIAQAAVDHFGKVDVLINNAAITRDRSLMKMSEAEWDDVIRVDLKGVFACTKAVLPYMTEQKWGRIINVASAAGIGGNMGQANYSAAKAGVIAFTRTCAKELGKYNITANIVNPSHKTRIYDNVPESKFEKILAARSLGRMSEPDEIPPAFIFLASDDASYITGQVLGVDGGLSL